MQEEPESVGYFAAGIVAIIIAICLIRLPGSLSLLAYIAVLAILIWRWQRKEAKRVREMGSERITDASGDKPR